MKGIGMGDFLSRVWARVWRRGVRPGDVWRDHLGIPHRITARDLWSGDGFRL